MLTSKERTGLIIAPAIAPAILTVFMGWPHGGNGLLEAILVMSIFGIPIAYVVALCIGLPMYWFAKSQGWVNVYTITLGGSFTAAFPMLVLLAFNYSTWDAGKNWRIHATLAATGFIVGFIYWAILKLWPK